MKVRYEESLVEAVAHGDGDAGLHDPVAVAALRLRLTVLMAAPTERALMALKALALTKAKDANEYSMRVTHNYSLGVRFADEQSERVAIVGRLTRQEVSR